jgi:hypothetical protein
MVQIGPEKRFSGPIRCVCCMRQKLLVFRREIIAGVVYAQYSYQRRGTSMRHTTLKIGILAGVLAVFAVGAIARQEGRHPDSQAQTQPGMMGTGGMDGGMMGGGGMMGMMNMMMGQNQQMSANMNQMSENMAAMQKEKDPAKRKSMMAQQSKMLEQMRGQMMQQGSMMQSMSGMMTKSCPMASDDAKPSTK